ncbi:hypothetical protein A176_001674 [Myxococcus hansupus]|uniref:Uncharacterized protein n=1 Tax=Pseudomyxococcus hansupus TaxID=1297742 RepID=A0A0H4XA34_9BACT|nr:hypothetical protein A176_001674 [Myxococcus hansupus]
MALARHPTRLGWRPTLLLAGRQEYHQEEGWAHEEDSVVHRP